MQTSPPPSLPPSLSTTASALARIDKARGELSEVATLHLFPGVRDIAPQSSEERGEAPRRGAQRPRFLAGQGHGWVGQTPMDPVSPKWRVIGSR